MATITRQRIRFAGDTAKLDGPRDKLRTAMPAFWRGNDLQFEIAVFENDVLQNVSNLTQITLEIRAMGSDGAPPDPSVAALMSKSVNAVDLNNSLTLTQWNDGSAQHALLVFTDQESNIPAGENWLVLWATTDDAPGRTITLAAGHIKVLEDGGGLATTPSPPQDTFYTAIQSDVRYAQRAQNLSDLADAATARTNLGLGTASTKNTGTASGEVPVLDGSGKLDTTILPSLAITSTTTSAYATLADYISNEWSAGSIQEGDAVILTTGQVYLLTSSGDGSLAGHYAEINPHQIDWANITNIPSSSETVQGIVELATSAETETGSDNTRAITPTAGQATYVKRSQNLADLADAATARTSLDVYSTDEVIRKQLAAIAEGRGGLIYDGAAGLVTVSNNAAIDGLFANGGEIWALVNPRSDGEASVARIIDTTDYSLNVLSESGGSTKIAFSHPHATTQIEAQTSTAVLPNDKWSLLRLSYDGSTESDNIKFYINSTISITTASKIDGAGAINGDTSDKVIGNRAAADRTFDGTIAWVGLFNDVDDTRWSEFLDHFVLEEKWRGADNKVYTSDFSVGADGWGQNDVVVAGNIDGIAGENDTLRFYANADNSTHNTYKSGLVKIGKKFRVSFRYYLPSANTNVNGIKLVYSNGVSLPGVGLETTYDAWTQVSYDFITVDTNDTLAVRQYKNAGQTFIGANLVTDDLTYLKDFKVIRFGAVLDLDMGSGAGFQIHDRSGNANHGLISATGTEHLKPGDRFKFVWTRSTSGFFGDADRNVLPANYVIDSIVAETAGTPTLSVGYNAANVTTKVASGALSAGTTFLTLVATGQVESDQRVYVDFTAGAVSTTFTIEGYIRG